MRPLAPLALAAALALSGCTAAGSQPATPAVSEATTQLDRLTVAAPRRMTGYARDHFPHWRKVDEDCDARDAVLKRDGTGVRASRACRITAGRWFSPFDEKIMTDPDQVDVDHLVPLANAWRSGADAWSDDRRGDFANDLIRPQLLAVSRSSNRAKGDQDPSQWRPPNHGHWCDYARRWIAVKYHWRLTVTNREKTALREMLGSCQGQSSQPASGSPTSSAGRAGS